MGWGKQWFLVAGRRRLLPLPTSHFPTSHLALPKPDPERIFDLIYVSTRSLCSRPFQLSRPLDLRFSSPQPLMASRTHRNPISQGKHDHVAATPPNSYPPSPGTLESGSASNNANAHGRKLASHYIHEGTSYDPSNAKEDYLRMAKDDVPDNKVSSASVPWACVQYLGSLGARTVLGGPFLPLPPWCV